MRKTSFIKVIRPIDLTQVKAPFVSVKSATNLTGLGEKLIRQLPVKRFGNTDFTRVDKLNEFINEGPSK